MIRIFDSISFYYDKEPEAGLNKRLFDALITKKYEQRLLYPLSPDRSNLPSTPPFVYTDNPSVRWDCTGISLITGSVPLHASKLGLVAVGVGKNCMCRAIDIPTFQPFASEHVIQSLQWNPEGDLLAIASGEKLDICDPFQNYSHTIANYTSKPGSHPTSTIEWIDSNCLYYTISGKLVFADIREGRHPPKSIIGERTAKWIKSTQCGSYLAVGVDDSSGSIVIYNNRYNQEQSRFKHDEPLVGLEWLQLNGTRRLVSCSQNRMKVTASNSATLLETREFDLDPVRNISVLAGSIFTGHEEGSVRTWNAKLNETAHFSSNYGKVVAISPDEANRKLYSIDSTEILSIWDLPPA